jgi:hypothetical protein
MSLWNVKRDMFIILLGLKYNQRRCVLTAESKKNNLKSLICKPENFIYKIVILPYSKI